LAVASIGRKEPRLLLPADRRNRPGLPMIFATSGSKEPRLCVRSCSGWSECRSPSSSCSPCALTIS